MKIALTQVDIIWEEKEKNKAICEQLVREAAVHRAELIIFPEMTLTGFTMNPEKYGEHSLKEADDSRESDRSEICENTSFFLWRRKHALLWRGQYCVCLYS